MKSFHNKLFLGHFGHIVRNTLGGTVKLKKRPEDLSLDEINIRDIKKSPSEGHHYLTSGR